MNRNSAFLIAACLLAAPTAFAAQPCVPAAVHQGKLGVGNAPITLQSQPHEAASAVARLNDMQYVCATQWSNKAGWSKVAVVPFLKGVQPFSMCGEGQAGCVVHDYPVQWVAKPAKGAACRLRSGDDGNSVYFRVSGACAQGWVPTDWLHQIAD